jgi:hypothetical protein
MTQKVGQLDAADAKRLEAQRTWVREHFAPEARHEYDSLGGKLRLLDTIVAAKWIAPSETVKLQSLGVTFGDVLVQGLGAEWVIVEDEHGRDPAVAIAGTSILLYPLTSISKRVERGEDVDVHSLYQAACDTVARVRGEQEA